VQDEIAGAESLEAGEWQQSRSSLNALTCMHTLILQAASIDKCVLSVLLWMLLVC
jgi:hypothetical protein